MPFVDIPINKYSYTRYIENINSIDQCMNCIGIYVRNILVDDSGNVVFKIEYSRTLDNENLLLDYLLKLTSSRLIEITHQKYVKNYNLREMVLINNFSKMLLLDQMR